MPPMEKRALQAFGGEAKKAKKLGRDVAVEARSLTRSRTAMRGFALFHS